MSIFNIAKENVNLIDTARKYGMTVEKGNFTSCIFHDERTPSMKLYDDHFYCFGCCKAGDVITLLAQYYGISQFESAKMLIDDFGVSTKNTSKFADNKQSMKYQKTELKLTDLLLKYKKYLKEVLDDNKPKNCEESTSTAFISTIAELDKVEYYLDILTLETNCVRKEFAKEYEQVIHEMVKPMNKDKNRNRNKKKVAPRKEMSL